MKKMLILGLLCSGLAGNLQAQFGFGGSLQVIEVDGEKDVRKLKEEQTLAVLLKEPDKYLLKKLKGLKKDEYMEGIEKNNQMLRNIFDKYWNFTDKVEYMTLSELKDMDRKKRKTYTVTLLTVNTLSNDVSEDGRGVIFSTEAGSYSNFGLAHYSGLITSRLANIHMPYLDASEADLAWAIIQAQNFMQARLDGMDARKYVEQSFKDNASMLAEKTLLIDANDLSPKLPEKFIKRVYPHHFKVVDRATIDQAILDQDPQYLTLKLLPVEVTSSTSSTSRRHNSTTGYIDTKVTRYESSNLYYNHLITDCEKGSVVSGRFLKTMTIGGAFPPPVVDKKSIQEYLKNSRSL